jgi:hypothetical protein
MSKIIPKLNLNKTPQQVENNSLIFAKNIKLLPDGTIGPDISLQEIDSNIVTENIKGYLGHIVGLDNVVYIFKKSKTFCVFQKRLFNFKFVKFFQNLFLFIITHHLFLLFFFHSFTNVIYYFPTVFF